VGRQRLRPESLCIREERKDRRQVAQKLATDLGTDQTCPLRIAVVIGWPNPVGKPAVPTPSDSIGSPAVVLRSADPNAVLFRRLALTLALL
jgi:hypothetical protein